MVDEKHLDFPPVIGVNRSRCIHHPDPMLGGQTAAGTHLGFRARREGNTDTGWNHAAVARMKHNGVIDGRAQVHPRGQGAFITR